MTDQFLGDHTAQTMNGTYTVYTFLARSILFLFKQIKKAYIETHYLTFISVMDTRCRFLRQIGCLQLVSSMSPLVNNFLEDFLVWH
jgi:hypothetical protein